MKCFNILWQEPLPFLDMVALEQGARAILTDSGSIQKEAFFYGLPCITMRNETEWIETVDAGWNQLVGASSLAIVGAVNTLMQNARVPEPSMPYGRVSNNILACTVEGKEQ